MGFLSALFRNKTSINYSRHDIEEITLIAQRLADVINESLKISNDSKNPDTKISRLAFAKDKLSEIKDLSAKHSFLKLTTLKDVERSIYELEREYQMAGYAEIANGNIADEDLEKEFSMGLLSDLFRKKFPQLVKPNGDVKTSGELIAEVTEGANLVEGKQTWEYAEEKKHDIEYMKKCCAAELKTMKKAGLIPAPYYFERVAILSRKEKKYQQEVDYCESYINAVKKYYENPPRPVPNRSSVGTYRSLGIDIDEMDEIPTDNEETQTLIIEAFVKRLPKAKELLAKSKKTSNHKTKEK